MYGIAIRVYSPAAEGVTVKPETVGAVGAFASVTATIVTPDVLNKEVVGACPLMEAFRVGAEEPET